MEKSSDPPASAPASALLRRGLDHYGRNETREAVRCWREVLRLDPDNCEARDYLEAAGADTPSIVPQQHAEVIDLGAARAQLASSTPPAPPVESRRLGVIEADGSVPHPELEGLLRERRYEEALELLYRLRARRPDDTALARGIRLLRERVEVSYAERLRNLDYVPHRLNATDSFMLTSEERQVMALVDGISSCGDILHVSALGRLNTLRVLCGLVEHERISLATDGSPETSRSQQVARRRSSPPPPSPRARPSGTFGAVSVPPGRDDGFDSLFRRATEAYLLRSYEDARNLFEECCRLRPDDRRSRYNLEALRRRIGEA
jgi:tetratricopeptide (TPR) repeat protein